jgi:hypothetical protein
VEVLSGVPAATREIDEPVLRIEGSAHGAEELESLLEAAGIDYLQVNPGDAGTGEAPEAEARTPRSIVEELEGAFSRPDPPKRLVVYASSVPTARGEERVRAWFDKRGGGNRARSTAG